ncbi:MAG TPA: metalloregulator ArsR/SmtB family transcription factor [Gemmatimonadales bacterium]|nr:metalloregulator ArsR/SmtB family transcription factor [Gemmatimonadales bacterium]
MTGMNAATSDLVFRAVADPTRRGILDLLLGSPRSVGDIVGRFRVSQPTISVHLRVLARAGLVDRRRDGRRIFYGLRPEGIRRVHDWSAHYARFWEDRLRALGARLDQTRET